MSTDAMCDVCGTNAATTEHDLCAPCDEAETAAVHVLNRIVAIADGFPATEHFVSIPVGKVEGANAATLALLAQWDEVTLYSAPAGVADPNAVVMPDGFRVSEVSYLREPPFEDPDAMLAWGATEDEWVLDDAGAVTDAINVLVRNFPKPGMRSLLPGALLGVLRRAGASQAGARHIITRTFKLAGSSTPRELKEALAKTWSMGVWRNDLAELEYALGCTDEKRPAMSLHKNAAHEFYVALEDAQTEAWLQAHIGEKRFLATHARTAFASPVGLRCLTRYIRERLDHARAVKKKSTDRKEQVRYAILDALLKGDDLTVYDDSHRVAVDDRGRPFDGHRALWSVMGVAANAVTLIAAIVLAVELPLWPSMEVILGPSLTATAAAKPGERVTALMATAKNAFRASANKRFKHEKEQDKERERLRAILRGERRDG